MFIRVVIFTQAGLVCVLDPFYSIISGVGVSFSGVLKKYFLFINHVIFYDYLNFNFYTWFYFPFSV